MTTKSSVTKKKVSAEGAPRRKKYSAPALEKGLDILELLSKQQEGLSVSEISKLLNRSVGELFRMLVVLEQRGYVFLPADSDRYMLSLQLFRLAHRFPPVNRLNKVAVPVLQKLAFDIEQSCHISIYYEGMGHVVVQQDAPSSRIFTVKLGAEAPLLDSCSGHILLAFAEDDERQRMLKLTPGYTKSRQKGIKSMIERVRSQGYESVDSAQAGGVRDIGFPVFDYSEKVVAALVTPFMSFLDGSHQVTADQARARMAEAAEDLSVALGRDIG